MSKKCILLILTTILLLSLVGCQKNISDNNILNNEKEELTTPTLKPTSNPSSEGKDDITTNITVIPTEKPVEPTKEPVAIPTVQAPIETPDTSENPDDEQVLEEVITPTLEPTPTNTPTPEPTNTPIPTATNTPTPTSTPVPTATNTPTPTPGYTFKELNKEMYAKASVNLRDLPFSSGEKIGTLKVNEKVTVIGQCNETNWFKIIYNGKEAYVSNNYLVDNLPTPTPLPTNTPTPKPTTTPVPPVSNTPTPLPTNTPVPIATNTPTPTSTPVPTTTNTPTPTPSYTFTELNKEMYVRTNENVRSLPIENSKALGMVRENEKVIVTGKCNETEWYRIIFKDNVAYINDFYLIEALPTQIPTPAPVDKKICEYSTKIDDCTFEFYNDGYLYIKGNGEIKDKSDYFAWSADFANSFENFDEQLAKNTRYIVVEEGVTHIGKNVLQGLGPILEVWFPKSLTDNQSAFVYKDYTIVHMYYNDKKVNINLNNCHPTRIFAYLKDPESANRDGVKIIYEE